jgi:signal transduction histidine kinase
VSKLAARFGQFEAPVDYGMISPWLQRVRAIAAGIIFITSLIGGFHHVPGAVFPLALAAAVAVHAIARSRTVHSPTESLVIDAFVVSIGLGSSSQAEAPLVAAAAYLIAASITFGGLKSLVASLTTFAAAVAVRPLLPIPDPSSMVGTAETMLWVAVGVFLGAVALSQMAAATEVFKAKRAQNAALAAERRVSEMKNEFVSMVTHELRTPLTNISGFADTLNETWRALPGEDVDEFLRIIVSESEHLKNLVEDVLAIPRLEAGRLLLDPTQFPLRPIAFKVVDLLFPAGGTRSASVSIGSNVIVDADPNRVEQVLRNLVENARKYGGNSISVEATPDGDDWKIVVADTGAGLTANDRERVFEAFEQVTAGDSRTETGFGLGLAVARHLVEAMGGRIWYEPGFPVGARFCFTLPTAQEQELEIAEVA